MNFKRGISVVMTIATAVVLIIISSTVIISGSSITSKTKLKKFGTEMLQVKEAVNQYVRRNSGDINWNTKEVKIESMSTEELEQYEKEDLTTDLKLYIVNLKEIGAESATYGLDYNSSVSNDVYLWSEDTGNIYYQKGYKNDEKNYYTLTEELMELIK